MHARANKRLSFTATTATTTTTELLFVGCVQEVIEMMVIKMSCELLHSNEREGTTLNTDKHTHKDVKHI